MPIWIICGGRVGRNLVKSRVWAVLDFMARDRADEEITVVHGGAKWTDSWAGEWAVARGHKVREVRVSGDLDGYRENAPKNRNRRMLNQNLDAECCLGFPGGGGTNNMMDISHAAGIPVGDVEINDDGTWEIKWWPQK